MFPLNTKQFSAAFLDVKRNSQVYNEEVSSVDRDATKKLLRPFHIPQIGPSSIPQCHHLGTMMWNFMWNCARRECYPPAHHLESREDSRMESRRAPEQSCSSVLPEFELHRVTSKRKAREANERQSAENIELSRLIKTQSLKKTSSTRITDSSRNNVSCVEAEPQNRGILQQSSCEEANVSNETFVNSKSSKSIGASYWDSDMKSSESEQCIVSDYFDRGSKLSPTCNVLSELETKANVNGIYGRESLQSDLVCNGDWWLNSENISNPNDSTAPLIPCACSIEESDFVGKKKFLERLLETELQIKPLTLVKDGIYSQRPVSNTFTLNLNLETVMSVLFTDEEHSKNAEHSDIDLCGKISILYGIQDTIVSVVASEVVGMYDYISGAVYGLKGCCHDESEYQLKDKKYPLSSSAVSLDLKEFIVHFQQKLRMSSHSGDNDNVLKEHSPVAWLMISPALGVTLDLQVQEKVLESIETLSSEEFAEEQASDSYNKGCFSSQWYNLLVVVDQYRCCEKDIPLIELKHFEVKEEKKGGREVLFQAGPEHPWLIKTYSEVAPHPCAQALGQDVFQSGIIPSDTDFRIFRDFGQVPGMDLAYIANGYVYHTNYDTPAAVTPGSIQRAGDNILALVKSIVNSPFLADPGEYRHGSMVFFDFLGIFVIHCPERIGLVINLTSAFVAVLCLMKKFLHFPAKRTISEEGKVLRLSSGIGDLIISLFILLLSWIVGTSFSVAVGVLLTYSGHSLTWYCQPYLLLALYTAPSLLGIGLVHFLIKKSIVAKEKAVSEKREDNIPLKERISNQLVKKEVETFYAAFLVWTIVMLIMSYYRLASAHLPLLFIIFPLVIRVVIWDNVLTAKISHENVGAFLFMYLLATLVPVQFCMYLTFAIFDVFMPIMGRAGTQTPPDVFISVLSAFGVVLLTSYMVSTVYVLGNLKLPAIFLLFVSTVGMVISLSGLSFPYSAINQCPKRVFFQHTSRTFYNNAGEVVQQDAGAWITPLDYLGIQPFSDIPMFKKALPAPQDGFYGGFPYYLPLRHLMRKSWYLPGPPPQVKTSPMEVKLLHRKKQDQVYSFKFSISGPDHMAVYVSPASDVDLLTSSLGPLLPIQDGGDRVVYFIYYSHGTDVGPWELSLELLPKRHLPAKSNLLDFAVAAHYIHGKESSSPFLKEVIQAIPDWIFANDWVDTYKSWSYTT